MSAEQAEKAHGWPDVKPGERAKYLTCRCGFNYLSQQDLFDHVFKSGYAKALTDAKTAIMHEHDKRAERGDVGALRGLGYAESIVTSRASELGGEGR